jgi:hypothetical protein
MVIVKILENSSKVPSMRSIHEEYDISQEWSPVIRLVGHVSEILPTRFYKMP